MFWPGESQRQRSLAGCSTRGREESDMIERLSPAHTAQNPAAQTRDPAITCVSPHMLIGFPKHTVIVESSAVAADHLPRSLGDWQHVTLIRRWSPHDGSVVVTLRSGCLLHVLAHFLSTLSSLRWLRKVFLNISVWEAGDSPHGTGVLPPFRAPHSTDFSRPSLTCEFF